MKTHVRRKIGNCSGHPSKETWQLCLYVVGHTGKSMVAVLNLKRLCEEHLPGRCEIQIIDLGKTPTLAKQDQIVITPTLIKKSPEPKRTVFGDLYDKLKVLRGLDLCPA